MQQSLDNAESVMVSPDQKVVKLVHLMEQPITFKQRWNVTVVLEYAPGKLIFGMDEPGYLLADYRSHAGEPSGNI